MIATKLRVRLSRLRRQYATWKKGHPHQQSEEFINQFLLLKSQFKAAGLPFASLDLPLDNDARSFTGIISSPPPVHKFGAPFAPVRGSGKIEGPSISLKDFEPYLKDFIIAAPCSWIVGGICERGKTEGDCDVLHMLPSPEEISRIIDFRIFRSLPPNLAKRIHALWEDRGARSPFTSSLPLYRLKFERIPGAEIVPMAEDKSFFSLQSTSPSAISPSRPSGKFPSGLPDTSFSEIKLRTKGTEKQLAQAQKALDKDRITPGEFWLMAKPVRAYYPGMHQTVDLFLDIYEEHYSFPALSSKKFDGEHLSLHKIKDKVIIYSEDGSLLTKLNNLRNRLKDLPAETVVLECELEHWNYEDGQHYPRESVNTNIEDDHFTASVFDCLYFKGKIPDKLHEEIQYFEQEGPQAWKDKYLKNWEQKVSPGQANKEVDLDLHKLPCAIRFKFLEILGIKQKTVYAPQEQFHLNIVEHFADYDRAGLEARVEMLRKLPGAEGDVVSDASRAYTLTAGRRPYQMLKFHNSTEFVAIVLDAVETKANKGIYNLKWALLTNDLPIKKSILREINGMKVAWGGRTFSLKEEKIGRRGDSILIECETLNIIYDEKSASFDFSAWAPRCFGKVDKEPDSLKSAVKSATKNHCFQAKVITADGKIKYLPGESGEEWSSKTIRN